MRSYRSILFCGLVVVGFVCAILWNEVRESPTPPPITTPTEGNLPRSPLVSGSVPDLSGRAQAAAVPAASAEVPNLLGAITPFRVWLDQFNQGQGANLREGLSLATARRAALHRLIQTDPEAALRQRIPATQRTGLPPEIAGQLEELVDAFSQYEVIAVCGRDTGSTERFATVSGRRYTAHTYGQRQATISQDKLATHGIAIDDQLALSADPFRVPDAGEISPPADANSAQAYVGDTVQEFSSLEELLASGSRMVAREQVLPSVFGEHTLLFLKIDFSDAPGAPFSNQAIAVSMAEADRFHRVESEGRTSFKTTILPTVLRSAKSKAFYSSDSEQYLALHSEATALARQYDAASGNSGIYNPDRYQHVVVLFANVSAYIATQYSATTWAGRADQTGKRLWLNGYVDADVIAHELGHSLGLGHSYAWKPTGNSPIQPGQHIEYGDPFDNMGAAHSTTGGAFSAPKKRALNYITDANVQTISGTGQYRIYRHDAAVGTNKVALRIDAGGAYDYWVEYRRDVASNLSAYADGVAHGVLIHWNKLPSFTLAPAAGTYLLDMNPGSVGGMNDSALTLGSSFYDPTYKIRMTPIQTGSDSQGDWIDVAVALGDRPTNRVPALQSVNSDATALARVAVTLTATGSDPDGDTVLFQWDMGDGKSVYTTGATLSYQWGYGGAFPVTVRAFDIYGGETRQTLSITVKDPLDAWTKITVPGLTEKLKAVCFGQGKFVAAGDFVSATSSDGKIWTRSTSGTSSLVTNAIAASPSRFVAVGLNWSFSQQTFFSGIFTSVDGANWTNVSPSRTETLYGVAYGNGRFVAVGEKGLLWLSSDGVQWTARQLVSAKNLWDVQFNGSSFLMVGDSGTALISSDGVSWQDRSLDDTNTNANGVSWFRDTSGSGVTILNGKWTVMTSWANSDKSARILWNSDTGDSWNVVSGTYIAADFVPLRLTSVGGDGVALVFPMHNDQPKFRFSSDGVVWTEKVLGPALTGSLRGGAEGKGRIVLVGEKGQIFVTADGLPALARQPQSQTVNTGQSATLQVTAYATGPFSYQWLKDGTAIPAATNSSLALSNIAASAAGTYSVKITNSSGTVTSASAALTVNQSSALSNLSVRTPMVAGQTLIVGAVVRGGAKTILVRAGGPALNQFQLQGMVDPRLELYTEGGTLIATNDNWSSSLTSTMASVGAFAYSPGSKDAALSQSLDGSITAQARGTGAGIILVEMYDVTGGTVARMINGSARNIVGTGENILIAGFNIAGTGTKRILVRGIGPGLSQHGVAGFLADPKIQVFDSNNALIATNDNWDPALASTFTSVGAFALASNSKDAALVITLNAGASYTVQVSGADGGTGDAIVEIYEVP